MPGFDPFILFQVLRYHVGIRSLRFVSGSLHRARIRSLRFVSSSLTSRSDSIFLFYFGFSSIMLGFDPFLLLKFSDVVPRFYYLFWHRIRISLIFLNIVSEHRLSFSASCPSISYLFRHRVRLSLSFLALSPGFPHLPRHHVPASLIFSGINPAFSYLHWHCFRITHLPRHCAWVSLSPSIVVTQFC